MQAFCRERFRRLSAFSALLGLTLAVSGAVTLPAFGQKPRKSPSGKAASPTPARKPMRGEDVVATVEGQPITRRELTYFWLQVDNRTPSSLLNDLLTARWKADKGKSRAYTITESEFYQRVFADNNPMLRDILNTRISMKLVTLEAKRKGIIVTKTQAEAYARRLFDQFRKQRGVAYTDAQIMEMFQLPRDVFYEDMAHKVRIEKLMEAHVAAKNGHPIGPEDWAIARELFIGVAADGDASETDRRFAQAREAIAKLRDEVVKNGRRMEDVARENNTNFTKETGGMRGAVLRGTGTKAMEDAIFRLKPGELTAPLRGSNGWYVFALERRGREVTATERQQGWQNVLAERGSAYLEELRRAAKITSAIPLAAPKPPQAQQVPIPPDQLPPPPPS